MATLKQRLHRKNASGTYDTVHFESSSDLILRPSGRTVEQDLADYLPEVQANDNVPESLKKFVIGTTKAFANRKELSYSDHNHNLNNLSGVLSASKGGTGVTSINALKSILGIGNNNGIKLEKWAESTISLDRGISGIDTRIPIVTKSSEELATLSYGFILTSVIYINTISKLDIDKNFNISTVVYDSSENSSFIYSSSIIIRGTDFYGNVSVTGIHLFATNYTEISNPDINKYKRVLFIDALTNRIIAQNNTIYFGVHPSVFQGSCTISGGSYATIAIYKILL